MSGKGNILLVANYPSGVGYAWWLMESYWAAIATHFSPRGRRCFLAYPLLDGVPDIVRNADIELLQHDFSDTSSLGLQRLRHIVRGKGITGVYLTDRAYRSWLYRQLRGWGVRRIVLHDHSPGERPHPGLGKRILKSVIHWSGVLSCDHYIGVSRFVYERFKTDCLPAERCSYVLNGIEPIQMNPELRGYAREQWNIPAAATIVVSTGRATYYKGIDFLVRVAARLIHGCGERDVYFLHCGDGPDLGDFKRMVRERRLEDRFIFAGRRNDIPQILQSCDIGIQASRGEAFSLSILEYMSAGLATLAPDNCGNAEAVVHGQTGFLFPLDDEMYVVGQIRRLSHDEDTRLKLGRSAAERILEHFTIERANRELVALLERVL